MESYFYYISENTPTKYISWDYIGPEKIDKYNINNVRNTDFEFGVHRDKYSRNETQFGFFAPIYIECEQDLPDYFMIDIILSNQNISTTKHIKININD